MTVDSKRPNSHFDREEPNDMKIDLNKLLSLKEPSAGSSKVGDFEPPSPAQKS